MIPPYTFVRDLRGYYDMPGIAIERVEVDGVCIYRVAWPGRSTAHWEVPERLEPVEVAPVMAMFELREDTYPIALAERTWKPWLWPEQEEAQA